jgi:zinc D-Ala-D-Ala carboxypeptidase
MQLTPHFADTELGVAGLEPRLQTNAATLCGKLLEAIHDQFGPIAVDDGYRNPAHNAAVGGEADSQHLYIGGNSAADIRGMATGADPESIFNWVRLMSHLPFDQVILEYEKGIPACVHISYDSDLQAQRRMALVGETNGTGSYRSVPVN